MFELVLSLIRYPDILLSLRLNVLHTLQICAQRLHPRSRSQSAYSKMCAFLDVAAASQHPGT